MRPGNIDPGSPAIPFDGPLAATDALRTYGRAIIGAAAAHDMDPDPAAVTGGGPFQALTVVRGGATATVTGLRGMENGAQLLVTGAGSTSVAALANTEGAERDKVGLLGAVVNNGAANRSANGAFALGMRAHGGAGDTFGCTIKIGNLPGISPRGGATPYDVFPSKGMTVALPISAGGGEAVFGRSYAVDAAIEIQQDGAVFRAGINFRHNALLREGRPDDSTNPSSQGFARAITLASEQGLSLYAQNSVSGVAGTQREAARIYAKFDGSGNGPSYDLVIEDEGLSYIERAVRRGIRINPGSGTVTPRIEARADDAADMDLYLVPQGNGHVRFGNGFGAVSGGGSLNAHPMTRYLAIKDGTATIGYIPVMLSLPS